MMKRVFLTAAWLIGMAGASVQADSAPRWLTPRPEPGRGGAGALEGLASSDVRQKRDHEIQWRAWGPEAFQEAQRKDRLILLDLTAVWCHWCHVMDETTYSDPEIIRRLNAGFIPIRVDADQRPDIQDRYISGGWPTTAILTPTGEKMYGGTYLRPDELNPLLEKVERYYREHPEEVARKIQEFSRKVQESKGAPGALAALEEVHVKAVLATVASAFDQQHGGFGGEPKFPQTEVNALLLEETARNDHEARRMALLTLDRQMGIEDAVWGGFFRYAVDEAWSRPHYEKLLSLQGELMDNYRRAWQITGTRRYLNTARRIRRYVNRFLRDPARGWFWGSQDADVGSHDAQAAFIPGEDYFTRGEAARRKHGIPSVDRHVYTNWNGLMIGAALRLAEATMDHGLLKEAIQALDQVIQVSSGLGGGYFHSDAGGRDRPFGLLSDEVEIGRAVLEAYQATGLRTYLARGEEVAGFLFQALAPRGDGAGFFDAPERPDAAGHLAVRTRPFDQNARAADFLVTLWHVTGEPRYRDAAENTLRWLAGVYPQQGIGAAAYALALRRFRDPPTRIVVVGRRDDKRSASLLRESLSISAPGRVVLWLDPAEGKPELDGVRYPVRPEPAAYACVGTACSSPVKDAAALRAALRSLMGQ